MAAGSRRAWVPRRYAGSATWRTPGRNWSAPTSPPIANLRRALGTEPSEALLRAGMASWARTYVEVLALPSWSADEVLDRVATVGERHLRAAWPNGAVIALPHLGNWDLAGAWACLSGFPVTTVAENLGEQEFAAYSEVRGRLGMEVLRHDDPAALGDLIGAVRRGRLVCLLSDRDLPGRGLPVRFAGESVTMPAGPALVARRAGATLLERPGATPRTGWCSRSLSRFPRGRVATA